MNQLTADLVRVLFPGYVREMESQIAERDEIIWEWVGYVEQLKDQIRLYTPTIVDYKIAKKIIPSVKLNKVTVGVNGHKREKNSYAIGLPGFDIPEDYDPVMDDEGIISFSKRPEIVNPVVVKDSKAEDNKPIVENKNGKDKGSFAASNDKAFYELVDLIMADRKIKKLPKDQFEWLKDKFTAWSKNPLTNEEYKNRFDGKFAK